MLVAAVAITAVVTRGTSTSPAASDKPGSTDNVHSLGCAQSDCVDLSAPVISSTAEPTPTAPSANPVANVGDVLHWSHGSGSTATAPSFTVTKIAKQRSKYGSEQVMVVMLHVETSTDTELNNDLSMALDPVVQVTDPDSGERKSPRSSMRLGDKPDTFGRNKKYDFGDEYKLMDVYDHGVLTINSNGGPGGGVDIPYDLR